MQQDKKKYNNKALLGTLFFHVALLVCFIFFGLTTPLPLPEEEGVLVSLGYTEQGTGQRQPLTSAPPPPQPQPTQSSQASENIATQSTEESVALPESPQDRQQPREDTRQEEPRQQETAPEQPQPEPEPQVNPNALFPGRDRQTTDSQSQGDSGEPGNQGREDGSIDGTATSGGGQGNGPEFSLTGRRANHMPLPEYNSQSQGKVVVSITVNRNGEVVRAIAGARGTTTSDRVLWAAAERAALRAKFDVKNDAAHEQKGTITYNFIRLN